MYIRRMTGYITELKRQMWVKDGWTYDGCLLYL